MQNLLTRLNIQAGFRLRHSLRSFGQRWCDPFFCDREAPLKRSIFMRTISLQTRGEGFVTARTGGMASTFYGRSNIAVGFEDARSSCWCSGLTSELHRSVVSFRGRGLLSNAVPKLVFQATNKQRVNCRAALMQATPLPMRSHKSKMSNSVEALKSLRLITAIKTPYLPDGRFDLEAFDTLVDLQVANGVEGLVVGGTTGEGQLMTWDEHVMLIAHTVNLFGDRVKVIGNTGSNSTREAIHATEQGFAVGMHGALHVNPYYGKTSTEGLLKHFESVLGMGPTIIYNVPARTGQDISPAVIAKVSGNPNFVGVKECTGNERVGAYVDKGLTIWSGNDDQFHDARWDYGARGVISVVSNLIPQLAHKLLFDGRNEELNKKLMSLINWLFSEPNPIGLNTALAQLGLVRPVFRLPYVPLSTAKRREFVQMVHDIGRQHFVGDKEVQILEDDDFLLLDRF